MIEASFIILTGLFSTASTYSSSSPPQGFACHASNTDTWFSGEKALITRAIGNDAVIYFEIPEKVVHKEQNGDELCIYASKSLTVGYSEPKFSTESVGRIKVTLAGAEDKSIVSYEYRFYRFENGNSGKSQLRLLFTFITNTGTGVRPLAWFSHDGFLGNGLVYAMVVITKNQNGKQYAYVQKASPK